MYPSLHHILENIRRKSADMYITCNKEMIHGPFERFENQSLIMLKGSSLNTEPWPKETVDKYEKSYTVERSYSLNAKSEKLDSKETQKLNDIETSGKSVSTDNTLKW